MNPAGRPGLVATWAALIVVYVVWGSTYLGIRVLVGFVPPLLAMGVRFLCAGILLAAFLAIRHGPGVLRVPPRRLLSAGVIGVLLLTCGNGGVAVAEQTVPSGLAALLVAEVPLWLVCLRLLARDSPRRATIAGTALGFAGIAILALPGGHRAVGDRDDHWRDDLLVLGHLRHATRADAVQCVRGGYLRDGHGRRGAAGGRCGGGRARPGAPVGRPAACLAGAGVPDRVRVTGGVLGLRLAAGQRPALAHRDLRLRQPDGRRDPRRPHPGRAGDPADPDRRRGRGGWRRLGGVGGTPAAPGGPAARSGRSA